MSRRFTLVMGGTQLFGRRLVEALHARGDAVTLATRGRRPMPFAFPVRHVKVDRDDARALERALGRCDFDVVYDQLCYRPDQARAALRAFRGRIGLYVATSTALVYEPGDGARAERDFDPTRLPLPDQRPTGDYAQGKRAMEAVFTREAPFAVALPRLPFVLAADDATGRWPALVEALARGVSIRAANLRARLPFITEHEAGRALAWLSESDLTGPVNFAAPEAPDHDELRDLIRSAWPARRRAPAAGEPEFASPYALADSLVLDCRFASENGFLGRSLAQDMPGLLRDTLNTLR